MSENKVEGIVTEGSGKLKDAAGGLTGDTGMQAEGKIDQLSGMAQREFGDTIDDTLDEAQGRLEAATELVRDNPLAALGVATLLGFLLGLLLIPSRKA